MIAAKYVISTCLLENGTQSSSSFLNFSIWLTTHGKCNIMGNRWEDWCARCIYEACAAYGRIQIIQKMRSWKHHLYSLFNHFHDFYLFLYCSRVFHNFHNSVHIYIYIYIVYMMQWDIRGGKLPGWKVIAVGCGQYNPMLEIRKGNVQKRFMY